MDKDSPLQQRSGESGNVMLWKLCQLFYGQCNIVFGMNAELHQHIADLGRLGMTGQNGVEMPPMKIQYSLPRSLASSRIWRP